MFSRLLTLAIPALLASTAAHGQAKPIYNDQSITVLQGLAFGPLRSEAIPVDDAHGLPIRCISGCAAAGVPTGAATAAKQDALLTALGTPLQAGGAVNPVTLAATSVAIVGTSTGAQVVGPFKPQLGRAITVALSAAAWPGGTAQLLRSTDSGTTKLPLTPAGVLLGTYTQQGVDQPWLETEASATFYLSLPAAGIGYRVAQ